MNHDHTEDHGISIPHNLPLYICPGVCLYLASYYTNTAKILVFFLELRINYLHYQLLREGGGKNGFQRKILNTYTQFLQPNAIFAT